MVRRWYYSARRFIIFLPFLIFLIGCTQKVTSPTENTTKYLIDDFRDEFVTGGQEIVKFHDSLIKKKYLLEGWFFKPKDERNKFPWPIFTEKPGQISFHWNRAFDRRILIKLLNIPPETTPEILILKINGKSVKLMPNEVRPGLMEFFLPSSVQNIGENLLEFFLEDEFINEVSHVSTIALHSVVITHGAVVKSTIPLANQVRPSLLLAAPISIRFPLELHRDHVLVFDYGMYSYSKESDKQPINYTLDISVSDAEMETHRIIKTIEIQSIPGEDHEWLHCRLDLPPNPERRSFLEFTFHADPTSSQVSEYLAMSEIKVFPQKQKWSLNVRNVQPDILLLTVSGVGSNVLPSYGYPRGRTPVLDRLSRRGTQFTSGFTVSNTETSAIMSIATGLFPRDHGVYAPPVHHINSPLPVLTQFLKNHGFDSYAILLGPKTVDQLFARIPSFQRVYLSPEIMTDWDGFLNRLDACLRFSGTNTEPGFFWIHLSGESMMETAPDYLENEMKSLTKDYGSVPIPLNSLHLPGTEQAKVKSLLGLGNDVRELMVRHDTAISTLDARIQEILSHYRRIKPRKKLVYLITSAHGTTRHMEASILSSDSLSHEILHVPLITGMIPEQQPKTNLNDQDFIHTRIADLLLKEYAAVTDKSWDSDDLTHWSSTSETILAEHGHRRIVALKKNGFKMIHCLADPYYRISTTNLFNIEDDPAEQMNLVGRKPDVAEEFLRSIMAFCKDGTLYPKPKPGLDEMTDEILEGLGYSRSATEEQ